MIKLKTFSDDALYVMPICFYPTTVMSVDDNEDFLARLQNQLKQAPLMTFSSPVEAINYFENDNLNYFRDLLTNFGKSSDIFAVRNLIYNGDRFKTIMVCIIDYEMPGKTGFDIMTSMGANNLAHLNDHSYILLTGKRYADFEESLAKTSEAKNFISKWDSRFLEQLNGAIENKASQIFQYASYDIARLLSQDKNEQSNFLFDGNFLPILEDYIAKNNIHEMYLFDRQGSYLLLDDNANLSWFFVRNEAGMENSITQAKRYDAPQKVIDAIKSRKYILSLYEEEDFESRDNITWDDYLLPATVLESNDKYTSYFEMNPKSKIYYAFTKDFPDSGIDRGRVVSYKDFLKQYSSK